MAIQNLAPVAEPKTFLHPKGPIRILYQKPRRVRLNVSLHTRLTAGTWKSSTTAELVSSSLHPCLCVDHIPVGVGKNLVLKSKAKVPVNYSLKFCGFHGAWC